MIRNYCFLRKSSAPFIAAFLAVLAALVLAPTSRAQELQLQLDQAQTRIEYSLGSTLHTVHGTFALKSGTLRFDPSNGKIAGSITVNTASGDSGNTGRDARMHREILESAQFPEIVFTPSKVTGVMAIEGTSKIEVSGKFRLHGLEHDMTIPVEIKAEGKKLRISAHFEIPYLQWGLMNPGNFLLHVSDKVLIDVQSTGSLQSAENR